MGNIRDKNIRDKIAMRMELELFRGEDLHWVREEQYERIIV